MRVKDLKEVLSQYEKVSIIGHDNIDVDAFLSGILLSKLLEYLEIKNEFIILEEVKENETYKIIQELFRINMKEYVNKKEDTSRKLLIEDHYETKHSGEVIACIDHHPNDGGKKYPFLYSRIACSTSYMVYELMQEAGYKISNIEAKMIIASMMIDTVSFRSGKTVEKEVIEAKKLAEQYGINYEELEKYCLCLTPIDEYSVNEIINNGHKYYQYNGNKVKSSYIQIYGRIDRETIIRWISAIKYSMKLESIQMWVFIIFECKTEKTYEYRITESKVELIESKGILSRGTNIMPKIEKLFS